MQRDITSVSFCLTTFHKKKFNTTKRKWKWMTWKCMLLEVWVSGEKLNAHMKSYPTMTKMIANTIFFAGEENPWHAQEDNAAQSSRQRRFTLHCCQNQRSKRSVRQMNNLVPELNKCAQNNLNWFRHNQRNRARFTLISSALICWQISMWKA